MSPPVRFQRHFLPWDRPWLPEIAGWLARDWRGPEPLDLSDTLAIVPTREAGRRLRQALAEHAAVGRAAVFPPRTQTPDTMLAVGAAAPDVASRLEGQLAWTDVVRGVDLAAFREVLPVAPPRRDFAWGWRLAENLSGLQTQLTENGLSFADVAERAGASFPEAERWRQLGELERLQAQRLADAHRRESHAARREFVQNPPLPAGIARIVVLAVPDPLPLAVSVLERWAERVPVEIVVCAEPAEADSFDSVGRPEPAAWARRVISLPEFEARVHLCADPAAEAAQAVALATQYEEPDGVVAFGLADPEVLPLLENGLARAAMASYNPEGGRARAERLYALLSALAAFAREPNYDAVSTLVRCPDFLLALQGRYGDGVSVAAVLAELDQIRSDHLPADFGSVRRVTRQLLAAGAGSGRQVARAVELLDELREALAPGTFPDNVVAALGIIFAQRRFDLSRTDDARAAGAAQAWRDVLGECAAARASFPDLASADWWDVALRVFAEARRGEEKPAGALELQGWLELLWEDAPHLVVAGLNDGLVPEAITGDSFLPESLRALLGLKTNAARFARDAYLLQALAARRRDHSRLDLLFAKTSSSGDPLRPSRLLLQCADADLPKRIGFLFQPAQAVRANLAWTRAWQLQVRRAPAPTRVPVTGLRSWLACPFRFYLRHVLRMEPVDPAKCELDERDFGTLCHTALEAMAREPALRDSTDEAALREFLLGELDRVARHRFGENLSLPLIVQLESARQRLSRLAMLQARERAAGWVIERVETSFQLEVAGLHIRGKIDRIDRNEQTGAWRVLDYKTADAPVPPQRTHLRSLRAGDERVPAWMRIAVEGRDYVWADLQLPIYRRALAAEGLAGGEIACGYINLPKAVGDTALALWHELTPEVVESARVCTDEVAAAIRRGEFWPPQDLPPDRDSFAALFHRGAEASVQLLPGDDADIPATPPPPGEVAHA